MSPWFQASGGVQTYASVASQGPPVVDHTHQGSPDSHMTQQNRDSHEHNSPEDEKPPSTHTVHS